MVVLLLLTQNLKLNPQNTGVARTDSVFKTSLPKQASSQGGVRLALKLNDRIVRHLRISLELSTYGEVLGIYGDFHTINIGRNQRMAEIQTSTVAPL